MTYNELRAAVKAHREAGRTSISLNSKKDVLLAELARCEAMLVEVAEAAIAEVEETVEVSTTTEHPVLAFLQLVFTAMIQVFWIAIAVTYSAGRAFRYLSEEAIDNGRFFRQHYWPAIAKQYNYLMDIILNLITDLAFV